MILLSLLDSPTSGIKGDSQVEGYENWIACTSISWALTREFAESAKGGTKDVFTGVAEIPPIEVGKTFDCASIDLMKYAAGGGKVCSTAKIHCLISGASETKPKDNVYLEFILDNPIISSWNISGDEDARPTETINIWYYKISLKYWQFDGTNRKPIDPKGWSRVDHKPWTGSHM